jgi:predicted membrane protein
MLIDKMIASPKTDDGTLEKTSGGIHIHVSPIVIPEKEEKIINTIEGKVNE